MAPLYLWVVVGCWAVFIFYWLGSWLFAKRSVSPARSYGSFLVRLVLGAIIIAFAWYEAHSGHPIELYRPSSASPVQGWIGAALAILGIAFAVWARTYLGRNWGMPMTIRENPELVTGGPYAYVRNPIYTGVLLAMIGTALATTIWWSVIFLIAAAYFIVSSFREERDMQAQFPDTYPAYKARTKRIIPFVW